jgi:hypothetical protein
MARRRPFAKVVPKAKAQAARISRNFCAVLKDARKGAAPDVKVHLRPFVKGARKAAVRTVKARLVIARVVPRARRKTGAKGLTSLPNARRLRLPL